MDKLRPNGNHNNNIHQHAAAAAAAPQVQQHLPISAEADPLLHPKPEAQRHWGNRDASTSANQWPPHQGQVGNATRSQFHGQMPHPDAGLEKGIEQDMEVGYEDSPSPLTLEALEKKFCDQIMRLAKEESDADDAENARHRERKVEITNQYQEKLSALRTLQAKRREEFLYKETQEQLYQYRRHQQYISNDYPTDRGAVDPRGYRPHQADSNAGGDPREYGPHHYPTDTSIVDPRWYGRNNYPTGTSPAEPLGFGGPAITEPPHRGYAPGPYEHYRERSPYSQVTQPEAEGRVPIPQGRAYDRTRARNF